MTTTLNFRNLPTELAAGVAALETELNFTQGTSGVPVSVSTSPVELQVTYQAGAAQISYPTQVAFFRGLAALVDAVVTERPLTLTETPQFKTSGLMIDMSRNAALNLTGLKKWIRLSAKLGLNAAMLYMEDVYAVPEYPYWGYQRGRLTAAELAAADDYAAALGVELIPCIQTLAHLLNPMRWPFMSSLRDMDGILLVGADATYDFLETIIKAAMRPFRTKKIHIGMDEAHDLGRGIYLNEHGQVDQTKIMLEHVQRVTAITERLHLDAVMWSDMWFNAAGYGYGDPQTVFPASLKEQIPAVGLMYWDYYNNSQANYEAVLRLHQDLGTPTSFATGVWTWNGIAPNYGKTMQTMRAGMAAAKKVQVDTVYATLWGDDGGETPFTAGALGIQYFAEQVYHREAPDDATLAAAFATYQHKVAADYLLLDQFDQLPELVAGNPDATNPSKIILYEDLLQPLFHSNFAGVDLLTHYRQLATRLAATTPSADDEELFVFYRELATTIVQKLTLMAAIRTAYQTTDRQQMKALLPQLAALATQIVKLQAAHRQVWFSLYSPFGWEVLDIRYGGLQGRCQSVQWRLQQWVAGQCEQLPELDEPALLATGISERSLGRGLYSEIVTASKISGV